MSQKDVKKTPPKHSRVVDGKRHVWYVPRLWELSANLPVIEVAVASVKALDVDCWFGQGTEPTIRNVAKHCQRIMDADLRYPIVLHADGSLMDGGHRLAKALIEGKDHIQAVRFDVTPEPDEIVDV